MGFELLTLTEKTIEDGFEHRNAPVLQKEALFLMNNFAMNLSQGYSENIEFVKPIQVRLKAEEDFLFQRSYIDSLHEILNYSQRVMQRNVDLLEVKNFFDSWFYNVTDQGILIFQYNEDIDTLNIKDAADYLNVSRTMLYKYIDRGLETVGNKNSQRIPKFILDAWKDPALGFKMQWNHQIKKQRSMSIQQRLEGIVEKIVEFELQYGNSFNNLYGELTPLEIDQHNESVDLTDWKELELERNKLLRLLRS